MKMVVAWDLVLYSFVVINIVSEELTCCIIALMMASLNFSEILISVYQTTLCNTPENFHRYTHHRENLEP